jgi:hypothetical protein
LNACADLRWLSVSDGSTSGWARLTETAELRHVRAVPARLADLRMLARWPRLASLDITGSGVASLEGLASATALRDLVLGRVGTDNLAPLAGVPGLRRLLITGPADWHPDLSAIRSLRELRFLQVQLGDGDTQGRVPDLGFLPVSADALAEVHVPLTEIGDGSLEPLFRYPALRACRLFGDYGRQPAALRAARPDARIDVVPDRRRRPPVATVGSLRVHHLAGHPPTYSIFQDLRAEMRVPTNADAADRVTRLVADRRPDLVEWIDVDAEAGAVGITSPSLERLLEVAQLLADEPS